MEPVNLHDFEALARERIEPGAFEYIAGGAGDEVSLHANVEAFRRLALLPRVLVDVAHVEPKTTVLGEPVAFPVLLAPTAFQTLAHRDGERATARAAAAAETIMVVSTLASTTLEEVAAAAEGPKWFQLYCYRDRRVVQRHVERAEAAGYKALCVTVDVPRVGQRDRNARSGFVLPSHAQPVNFRGLVDEDETAAESFGARVQSLIDPSLTWESVDWLRSITDLPVVLKGILRADDAARAVAHGASAIVVSNHGARQLDTVPATISVLSEIVAAVDGQAEIMLDGGVRRGTDVLKALALGARAVLIGRPYVWGLGADGERGVRRVLTLLRAEVELAMALLGCPTVADVSSDFIRPLEGANRYAAVTSS